MQAILSALQTMAYLPKEIYTICQNLSLDNYRELQGKKSSFF